MVGFMKQGRERTRKSSDLAPPRRPPAGTSVTSGSGRYLEPRANVGELFSLALHVAPLGLNLRCRAITQSPTSQPGCSNLSAFNCRTERVHSNLAHPLGFHGPCS